MYLTVWVVRLSSTQAKFDSPWYQESNSLSVYLSVQVVSPPSILSGDVGHSERPTLLRNCCLPAGTLKSLLLQIQALESTVTSVYTQDCCVQQKSGEIWGGTVFVSVFIQRAIGRSYNTWISDYPRYPPIYNNEPVHAKLASTLRSCCQIHCVSGQLLIEWSRRVPREQVLQYKQL